MLPLRHAGRTAAVASRLSRAAGAQIAARTAEQLFVTLGELKSGAAKLGQAISVFEAAMPKVRARSHPSAPHPLSRDRVPRAASAFADENGIGTLSMRKLGEAVGSRRCPCITTSPTKMTFSTA